MDNIKTSAIEFYSNLFSLESNRGPIHLPFEVLWINDTDNEMMQELPSIKEVKSVIFAVSIDSAQNQIGFGVGFYKPSWGVIGKNLLEVIFKGISAT